MASKKKPKKAFGAAGLSGVVKKNGTTLLEAAKSAPRTVTGRRGSGFTPVEIDQRVELALAYMTGSVAASQVAEVLNIDNVGQFASQALWAGVRSGRWTIQRAK